MAIWSMRIQKKGRLEAFLGETLYGYSREESPDLSMMGKIFNNPDEADRQRRLKKFKEELLYPEALLINKDSVPNSYFELQLRIARQRGQGADYDRVGIRTADDFSPEARKKAGETIYRDQKKSLDVWADYLSSPEAGYPTWFKFYVLKSVIKMGVYDKDKKEFSKRTKDTTTIFPDLNREALAYCYDVITKYYLKREGHVSEELRSILESTSFSRIYAFAIDEVTPASKENKEKTRGEWIKFDQGGDHIPLYKSLQGHGTGWCTAGEEVAKDQLSRGDFYVYYTEDEKGNRTIPRIAIRMEEGEVFEVRGINPGQNLEPNMLEIAKNKYQQLPGGSSFEKKDRDMERLTLIDGKVKAGKELTRDELRFLYEINQSINGFGYEKDPRVGVVRSARNQVSDINVALEDIEVVESGVDLSYLTSLDGINLPRVINGDLNLSGLVSIESLKLPQRVNGVINLSGLSLDEIRKLPEMINGGLVLSIPLAEYDFFGNLNVPEMSTEGLRLPLVVDGDFCFDGLLSAKGVDLPKVVGGNLDLSHLKTADGLKLPETISGSIFLPELKSADGLVLPKIINGGLSLDSLESISGLELPDIINGGISLRGLKSADGLVLSGVVGGGIDLGGLTSAQGLVLPEVIKNGDLFLFGLQSAQGLELPKVIEGELCLSTWVEVDKLPKKVRSIRFFSKTQMSSEYRQNLVDYSKEHQIEVYVSYDDETPWVRIN
ncbi:MAG TPA: hypothetical protein PKZ29_01580 [Candidatus Woesebacteria bacterium]|nr:hypothetical protein [Candidatus Woesebacteria bacterium]HOG37595.1 hypothetical protein [Candidatus Woesebacteria bacterium]